jgi:hypothetical protein
MLPAVAVEAIEGEAEAEDSIARIPTIKRPPIRYHETAPAWAVFFWV